MTEKQRLDKIAELKSEMRSMIEVAGTEKRDLNADEQATFDKLDSEVRMHNNYFRATEVGREAEKEPFDIRSIFAKNLSEAIESGNKSTKIDVRANIPIDSVDIVDTIPVLYKDVIKALEPKLIINQVGLKMQTNVQGTPVWPTVGTVEAQILGENALLDDKSIDFSKISATPKRAGITLRLSRRAINQSNLNLYDIVVEKIADSLAMLINKWLVSPTAIATNCEGVFVKSAAAVIPLSKKPYLDEVVGLETSVLNSNVNGMKGLYVLGTAMRGNLKTQPIQPGNPAMILTGSEMNGYPVVTTNLLPSDHIGFGFFEYAVLSQFGAFSMIVDPYTLATQNEVRFTGNSEYDITVLRPEAFSLGKVETAAKIYSDKTTISFETEVNKAVTTQVVVKGINLTEAIAAAKTGTNATMVTLSATSFAKDDLGKVDSILTITYTPTAASTTHAATITLTSAGASNVVITIGGIATA